MASLRLLTLLILATLLSAVAAAQNERPWMHFFQEAMASDGDDDGIAEEAYETLCDLEANPMNINTATYADLCRLPFLSERNIDDILAYRDRHGYLMTKGELQAIPSLDHDRMRLLACFIAVGPPPQKKVSLGRLISRGKSTLLATATVPLYERRGYRNGYLGYKPRHSLRYDFSSSDKLRFGLTGSQDSGEPFMAEGNTMGYDHYSFYVQMRNLGRVSNIVAGHYRVQFGMGLVANTGFSPGKTAILSTLGRSQNTVSPVATRSAAGYFQGVAATVTVADGMDITAFASARPHDATLNDDGTVATIITSGYHRTPTEMGKKNNTWAYTTGANVRLRRNHFHIGATATYTHYNRDLHPSTTQTYKQYYPRGNDFANAGVDYGFSTRWLSLMGETAIDRKGAVATVNTVSLSIGSQLSLVALHRYYSHKYASLYARSFSDGGRVANEHGAYVGLEWRPTPQFAIDAYADYAHYPWARYRISHSSDSYDAMLSCRLSLKRWTLSSRYRLRMRYFDNADKTVMVRRDTHRARLKAVFEGGNGWGATTQTDFALVKSTSCDRGFMLAQRIDRQWRWLRMSVSGCFFCSDSYDSRLYVYEQAPLQSFSFPSLYGRGVRYAALARAELGGNVTLLAKVGVTNYFDRSTIGTGLQTINHSSMADLDVQLRWKF